MRRINVVSSRPGSTFGTTKSMTAQDHVPVLREEVLKGYAQQKKAA